MLARFYEKAVSPARWTQPRCARQQSGFTLIELGIAIVLIALLLGGLLVPLGTQIEQRKIAETQRTLDDIKEALLGFAMTNGFLPRPATSTSNGQPDTTDCTTSGTPDATCTGFVPWAALGVQRADAWGKLFKYSVSPNLTGAATTINLATNGNRFVCSASLLDLPADPANTCNNVLAQNVAVVVISFGADNYGTTIQGTMLPDLSTSNLNEDRNNANLTRFYARPFASNPASVGGEIDDLVVWIPTTILMNRLVTAGKQPTS